MCENVQGARLHRRHENGIGKQDSHHAPSCAAMIDNMTTDTNTLLFVLSRVQVGLKVTCNICNIGDLHACGHQDCASIYITVVFDVFLR